MDFKKLSSIAKNKQVEEERHSSKTAIDVTNTDNEDVGIEDETSNFAVYEGFSDEEYEDYDEDESVTDKIKSCFDYDVRQIRISTLVPYHNHTFNVNDDETIDLAQNIERFGVLEPLLICPSDTVYGKYEVIAGHRRLEACKLLCKETVPCRIAKNDTAEEILDEIMVISNLERRNKFTVSELSRSIRVLYNARKHQGFKLEGAFGDTSKDVAAEFGISQADMHRYLRFAELNPYFLDLLDNALMAKNTAYSLSFLDEQEQGAVQNWLVQNKKSLDKLKAEALCKAKRKHGQLDQRSISVILSTPEKEKKKRTYTIGAKLVTKYFADKTQAEIEEIIQRALHNYFSDENEREE